MRINVRLNPDKDKDIINELSNVKDISKAIRSMLRAGITTQPYANAYKSGQQPTPLPTKTNKSTSSILDNIMQGFD